MFYFSQIILLEESWAELFLLCAIQWSLPMETSPLLVSADIAQNVPNGKAVLALGDLRILQEIFNRFKAVQVDPAEFACLKAIALFRPGHRLYQCKKFFFLQALGINVLQVLNTKSN